MMLIYFNDFWVTFKSYYKYMSKKVDIEYCGAWGYGGPAMKLKQFLLNTYGSPLEINVHSANGTTGTIKVAWIKNGALQTVW